MLVSSFPFSFCLLFLPRRLSIYVLNLAAKKGGMEKVGENRLLLIRPLMSRVSLISDQHSSVSRACQSACQEGCHFVYYCHRHRLNIFRTSFLLLGLVERKLASCSTPPLPFLSSRHSCSYNDLINSYTLERSSDTHFSRLFWKTVHFFFLSKTN